ncbi:PREDICTED: uncharacterized protein LOC109474353 [Branchiostoma belcheri]|uniref:Activated RNA polymerase II transcriptional coactivator p15 n=1 Tax=Branchiostoma belcheri TaxID=7741 RepID=A0A6P4YL63_BRABE|nr:PREDICTED: uncharacterized protein LOC109474353 [Branchiostoma belcheri]
MLDWQIQTPQYVDAATQTPPLYGGAQRPTPSEAMAYSTASCSTAPPAKPNIQYYNETKPSRSADYAPPAKPNIQYNNETDGLEVRFPVGEDVFATIGRFKGKALMGVRQFYRPYPEEKNLWKASRKELVLTPDQWRVLKRNMSGVSTALLSCTFASMPYDNTLFSPRRFGLGNLRYAIVEIFRGKPVVALREFYRPKDGSDKILPGKKGINLSTDQWQALETHSQKMDAVLEAVLNNEGSPSNNLITKILEE